VQRKIEVFLGFKFFFISSAIFLAVNKILKLKISAAGWFFKTAEIRTKT
jgi:hypothetical protein